MAEPKPWEKYATAPQAPLTPGGLGGTFIPTPVDPMKDAVTSANLTRTQQQIDQERATEGARVAKANAEARAAIANAEKIESENRKAGKIDADPAVQGWIDGLKIDQRLKAVNRARAIIDRGRATGIVGQVGKGFWGSDAADLKGALSTIQGGIVIDQLMDLKKSSPNGASGMGALSEKEGAWLANAVSALNTDMSSDSLLDSLNAVEGSLKSMRAIRQGFDPANDNVRKQFGLPGAVTKPSDSTPDPQAKLTKGGTETVKDPTLAGLNARVARMIRSGRADDVPEYLESIRPGLSKGLTNVPQWEAFLKEQPDYKGPIADLESVSRELGGVRSFVNDVAQSAPGAAVIGAADTLSMGTLDNMTGNPALTRAGMAGLAEDQPLPTLGGQVLGALIPGMGVQGLAARAGASPLMSAVAGDVLPGIAYGAGSSDETGRVGGAAIGGLAGLTGGFLGRGAGRLVSGVGGDAGYLAREGVRQTVPQLLGGTAKALEDKATSLPFVGDMIQNIRRGGIEDFNSASFRQALAPVTEQGVDQIGEAGVGQAQQIIGQAYDSALSGRAVQVDGQFGVDLAGAVNRAASLPRAGEEVADTIREVVPGYISPEGALSGTDVQPLLRELRDYRGGYRNDPLGSRIADRVQGAENAVTGMFERQAPDVMPALNAANEAYSNLSPVMDAVLAAKSTNGTFMPSQLGSASVANAKRFGGRNAAARGDRALFDLQRAGQNVLPSRVPDSGTVGRYFLPGALGIGGVGGGATGAATSSGENRVEEAGSGAATGLALTAALLSPYMARGALQRVLTANRNPAVQWTGDVIGRSRLPGALALPYFASGQ